ncbi:hypothetical protein [Accumulibacter sp.]|uniref:hypothetical protein n=1 Tax=Accumulibacter sp. TaxID=2053492 RepID=UPI00262A670B|nr:hypothetical protein [Accumulibacter sp.]
MSLSFKPSWRTTAVLFGGTLVRYLIYASWRQFFPVSAATGWQVQVYRDDITMISALATQSLLLAAANAGLTQAAENSAQSLLIA